MNKCLGAPIPGLSAPRQGCGRGRGLGGRGSGAGAIRDETGEQRGGAEQVHELLDRLLRRAGGPRRSRTA
jgi:hypothetical protein